MSQVIYHPTYHLIQIPTLSDVTQHIDKTVAHFRVSAVDADVAMPAVDLGALQDENGAENSLKTGANALTVAYLLAVKRAVPRVKFLHAPTKLLSLLDLYGLSGVI